MSKHGDQAYYYLGEPYLGAFRGVYHGLTQTEAFVQLLGPANTGKSSLCEKLALYMRR